MIQFVKTAAVAMLLSLGTLIPAHAEGTAPEPVDFSIGAADAKVKMVEYASFTCPHCAQFHADVYGKLKADYIDTGKVHFTLREVYFDRYGLWASMVARCGGEMRYFGMQDILFSTQRDWAGSDDPAVVAGNLKTMALSVGMDGAAVDACMKDAAMADALIKRSETNMTADDVQGTPTIFVNGVKYSNMPYADLKAILDAELAK